MTKTSIRRIRAGLFLTTLLAGSSVMAQSASGLVVERTISLNAAMELATTSL